jgi:hypothetical protein
MAFQTKEQRDQYYQDNKAKFKSAYEKHKRENPKYKADYYQQNKEILFLMTKFKPLPVKVDLRSLSKLTKMNF